MHNQIIVVEGVHDQVRVQSLFKDAHVVITHGREISSETIQMLKTLANTNEIILLLDPDGPGEKIRSILTMVIPTCKQAFLEKKKCISANKKKVGIEHATDEDIKEAIERHYTPKVLKEEITIQDMHELGLIGHPNSRILRDKISTYLNIGKPNAKTFLKRINLYGISLIEIKKFISGETF